jgi:hypothetical protein
MKRAISRWAGVSILAASVCAGLLGCGTPRHRADKYPALYTSLPADVQANVRQGRIDLGYPKDAVFIALGKPDREYLRVTDAGMTELWSYVDAISYPDRKRVRANVRVRDGQGRYRTASDSVWVEVQNEREYERLRVEFKEGRVSAIERVQK